MSALMADDGLAQVRRRPHPLHWTDPGQLIHTLLMHIVHRATV